MPKPTNIDRMLLPHEALEIIANHISQLPEEQIPFHTAFGRILTEDIVASEPYPPFPASTMDGYAVIATDASPWREIIATQNAGDTTTAEVTEGYCVRIMTGAPLPPGSDAVVPVEATELADDNVRILQEDVAPGQNLRPVGADIAIGELLIRRGTRLGAAEIGLLASLGRSEISVSRKPRITILSTGDELVEPDQHPGPGQIRDANRFALAATLANEPVEISWIGIAPDDRDALERLLRERLEQDDVILTSGGVSMGERDYIKAILYEATDIDLHFRRLFMKPGKPLTFATCGTSVIFGLPGNPVSALATFDVFVRPAIHRMIGASQIGLPQVDVTLAASAEPSDRVEYQRGIVEVDDNGQLIGRPNGHQRSSRLASYIDANAYLIIPPRESTYEAGERVAALLISPPTPLN
ncbi:MAG: molybdopterin molybdotransferase MoeA [Thermomicrobiales bacterium]|nr:molybdopterin molybdotransferase MoeA [Thermomicrobiales bacterium]MCO5225629.1 molybdopterin molybdotransferase MoeA [Thermomicrobiales bacterium]MCO5228432.1 molybdopterin molybdotransferase MoeA [Thermomicrobiales bacterium]